MKGEKALGLLSRMLISGIFIGAGINKLRDREGTQKYMESKGMPMIPTLMKGAVAMELGVAPAVTLGLLPRFSAPLLATFLIPTTLIFHNFWKLEGTERQMQMIEFMKNLAILGGLLSVALHDAEHASSRKSRLRKVESHLPGEERPGYLDELEAA